jgi:hypothetical protein
VNLYVVIALEDLQSDLVNPRRRDEENQPVGGLGHWIARDRDGVHAVVGTLDRGGDERAFDLLPRRRVSRLHSFIHSRNCSFSTRVPNPRRSY